jgi:hypothetical protein
VSGARLLIVPGVSCLFTLVFALFEFQQQNF